jgi:succinate dehydrogenase/fumarate reductase flavoprotein subunit/uncharacterized protein with FMN-binding domain
MKMKPSKKFLKRSTAVILAASLTAGCSGSSTASKDGTYEATNEGFGGDVTITITIKDGEVTEAEAVGDDETAAVGGQAIKAFNNGDLGELVGTSADEELKIDSYSGATVTSTALKNDIEDINSQIAGENEEDTGEKTAMKAGTYTETVYGNNYSIPFTVDVTLSEDSIEKIEVTDIGGETEEIIQTAIDNLIPSIEENQSIAVDSISGATASSSGIKDAVKQAIDEAGGDSGEWYTAVEKKTDTVELDDYDVIVVGLGAAGMSAYCSAAQTGAAVIGIETAAKVGGASTNAGGPAAVNPSNEEVQPAEGTQGYPVDEDALKETWMSDANQNAKEENVDLMIDQSGETLDWMIEENGLDFNQLTNFMNNPWIIYSQYNTEKSGSTVTEMYQNALDQASENNEKDQYLLQVTATGILKDDDGNVAGISAEGADGTKYNIYAPTVILCTGGYGGNSEMTEEYLGSTMHLYGMQQNDGTMLQAAIEDFNADTYNISSPGIAHGARTSKDIRSTEVEPSHQKILDAIVTNPGVLMVGSDGKRFTAGDSGSEITESAYKAGEHYYAIVSEKYMESIKENGIDEVYLMLNMQDESMTMEDIMSMMQQEAGAGSAEATADASAESSDSNKEYALMANDPIDDLDQIIDIGEDMEIVYEADSIEELADQIGAENLAETVENYNAYADAGNDPEFSKSAENMSSLDDGSTKYYAIEANAYNYSTTGGLNVNENIEVLDQDGNVIKGLYACGTDSLGTLLDEDTGYMDYGGIAHGWCFTSGKTAGKNAAEYAASLD